ncbi:P-loop containing nucleoside triphosphate hydrolase protein [Tribonema minus]|uniref:P-loop containing nucleoside triphosphate hydrolase protein n=1 Tax=Tribonema minus TaxID=303371 RepID=A0A836CIE4_9STRA|nr:P-loop containing nucleoside triphosphate hydrolase protein [Tribonema minus]
MEPTCDAASMHAWSIELAMYAFALSTLLMLCGAVYTCTRDDAKPAKKTKTARSTDPFSLAKAQTDFTNLTSPLLEIFHWSRVVVDEYTYIEGEKTAITSLSAQHRWCLSGTPPTSTFQDINGIAAFLGVKLGVADTMEVKNMSKVELFRHFQQTYSSAWHTRRHELAQEFLERYVRQNVADIDEIPFTHNTLPVTLSPAERAIYIELDAHLHALDMKSAKIKNKSSDRDSRLSAILGSSSSAEEALVKRCSMFEGGGDMCSAIIKARQHQLEACVSEFNEKIIEARILREAIVRADSAYDSTTEPFSRWRSSLETDVCGDGEANALFKEQAVKAFAAPIIAIDTVSAKNLSDKAYELREMVHAIRSLQKECVGRLRSLRFFIGVRKFQQGTMDDMCICGKTVDTIISSCGHSGCHACIMEHANKQLCVADGCHSTVHVTDIVSAPDLGTSDTITGNHGAKVDALVSLVQQIPSDERALVFVQFDDLMQFVAEALEDDGIKALQLKGSVHQRTSRLESFQNGQAKVLLLDIAGESASGANLTVASHVIFYHPLVTPSKQQYAATQTQAIGRAVRYGQTRKVHITHMVAAGTIETEIMAAMS